PAPPLDFAGRDDKVAAVCEELKPSPPTAIPLLHGMPDIRKPTLAFKVAHVLRPSFTEGQLYVDLLGASPEPLSPARAMEVLLLSLNPFVQLPKGDSLAHFYRRTFEHAQV